MRKLLDFVSQQVKLALEFTIFSSLFINLTNKNTICDANYGIMLMRVLDLLYPAAEFFQFVIPDIKGHSCRKTRERGLSVSP
jgi:hypothetical protein